MSNLRILIADDHCLMRRGIKELLESHPGWTICTEAETGREAVEQAEKLKPDIAILDITMPELNGIEAAPHAALRHWPSGLTRETARSLIALHNPRAASLELASETSADGSTIGAEPFCSIFIDGRKDRTSGSRTLLGCEMGR